MTRLVREGMDWKWLSALAGQNGGDGDGADDADDGENGDENGENGDDGSSSPSPPSPPSPSCWLPPSAVDCEWAGGGRGGGCVLPASYATHDRVFAQVAGTRRVLVAEPRDALEK